jgi:hypothetical protein
VEANGSSPKNLPQDIQAALQKHEPVLRQSCIEIVSGINRLLRRGIPKEVISQVLTHAVEAVAKDFNPLTLQDFYSRIETQPDAFTTEEASLREPPHTTRPPALAAFAVEDPALTAENSSVTNVPECGEISASGENLNVSVSLHDLIPALPGPAAKQNERELCLGSIACPSDSAAQLIAEMKGNLAVVSPIPSFHLMPRRGGNGPSTAAKGSQMSASEKGSLTLDKVNQLPRHPQWPRAPSAALRRIRQSTLLVQGLLRRWVFEIKRDWIAMINAIALPEMKKPFLHWLHQPYSIKLLATNKSEPVQSPSRPPSIKNMNSPNS